MHLLKNGHPAHVFTDEDRRKAADVTNEIRREKRALFEQLRLNEQLEQMFARDAARRERKAAKERRRRQEKKRLTALSHRYEPLTAPTYQRQPRRSNPPAVRSTMSGPGLSTQAATPGDQRILHRPAGSAPRRDDGLAPRVRTPGQRDTTDPTTTTRRRPAPESP
jgi:hypothetical protein